MLHINYTPLRTHVLHIDFPAQGWVQMLHPARQATCLVLMMPPGVFPGPDAFQQRLKWVTQSIRIGYSLSDLIPVISYLIVL